MGLIAGIQSPKRSAQLREILGKMRTSQAHRDNGSPIDFVSETIAISMVNIHNDIYYGESQNKSNETNIQAFVDGIVLNSPAHYDNFLNKNIPISDTKCTSVVAAAYQHWGEDFIRHLDGEFACVVWDRKNKKLILCRDPYGHKPLHYFHEGSEFIFASEIKGVLAAGVEKEINKQALSDFLTLNNVPCPHTMFKNIYQVPPGSMVIYGQSGVTVKTYHDHRVHADPDYPFEKAVQQLEERIRSAVSKRMIGKKVFCFLSGGIDSSALISFASELSEHPIEAISIGFEEEERNELSDATIMAQHVGAKHHQLIALPESFHDMLDTIVFHQDSPFTDTSSYPTYFAAKLARSFTDLILTGDGPDQTMGGSGHHVKAVLTNAFADRNAFRQLLLKQAAAISGLFTDDPLPTLVSKMQRKLHRDSVSPVHAAYDLRSYFPDIVKKYLCTHDLWDLHRKNSPYQYPESWFAESADQDGINKYLYADIKFYIPDDLMIKVDRMCMAHNLETLSPFQDLHIAELVNRLPGKYKIHRSGKNKTTTKYVLKKVCENRFPSHTLYKKKSGFGIPVEKWLLHDNGEFIRDVLLDSKTLSRGYFRRESITRMIEAFIKGKGDYFYPAPPAIIALLTLELWHRRYLDA
ncbi:asparagine synthase (glutamine-hydrolyzing) [candidate division KSB1 bacterium]|nr:asparagine synthase (glutamine-hydrolyzing) [candidate division KSB1 bacterium]